MNFGFVKSLNVRKLVLAAFAMLFLTFQVGSAFACDEAVCLGSNCQTEAVHMTDGPQASDMSDQGGDDSQAPCTDFHCSHVSSVMPNATSVGPIVSATSAAIPWAVPTLHPSSALKQERPPKIVLSHA